MEGERPRPRTLLVDGTNLVMRAQKASEAKLRLSSEVEGQTVATGPTLLFINQLSRHLQMIRPLRLVVCFDGGGSKYRQEIFPEYKQARREKPKDEAEHQTFSMVKEFLTLSDLDWVEQEGVEADDLIAHYRHSFGYTDEVYILSGDKDFLQLVGKPVDGLLDPGETRQIRPGINPEIWTESTVFDKYGCIPSDLAYVKAMVGDPSDGIPGVRGIGEKTAVKLLAEFNWDFFGLVYSDHKRIAGHRSLILRNYRLVDLQGPIPLPEPLPYVRSYLPVVVLGDGKDLGYVARLLEWTERYGMDSVRSRLLDGSLWR